MNGPRRVPGRWFYVAPSVLFVVAIWMAIGPGRASSRVDDRSLIGGTGAERTDLKRFRVVGNGIIEDAATGIRRPLLPAEAAAGGTPFDGVDLAVALPSDLRYGVGPRPQRLRVPSIGLDAPIVPIGLDPTGALAVPEKVDVAGWWSGGPIPGEAGPTVVVGHYDSKTAAGVFEHLPEVGVGNVITVERSDGWKYRYRVTSSERIAKSAFPTGRVYGATAATALRLVTCGGRFDRSTGHYVDNVIVYAEYVSSTGPDFASYWVWTSQAPEGSVLPASATSVAATSPSFTAPFPFEVSTPSTTAIAMTTATATTAAGATTSTAPPKAASPAATTTTAATPAATTTTAAAPAATTTTIILPPSSSTGTAPTGVTEPVGASIPPTVAPASAASTVLEAGVVSTVAVARLESPADSSTTDGRGAP